jgi:uncharacterized ferredoxin-like protein
MSLDQKVMSVVAGLMELAARTAPKAGGQDYIETKVLEGEEVARLADAMVAFGERSGKKNFDRDGANVRHSAAVLLVSVNNAHPMGLDCGACGYRSCAELPAMLSDAEFAGPVCAWRVIDLGVALGSAAKTAGILNADNRIMYRIGVVARREQMIDGEIVVGIPISATGKSIYFDR